MTATTDRLTPTQKRACDRDYADLLAPCRELLTALTAVADDASYPDDLRDEARGMLFTVTIHHSSFECDAYAEAFQEADRRVRRMKPHADPVYRVVLAFRAFRTALDTVLRRHARCEGCSCCWDADGVAYAVKLFGESWESAADGHLSRAAEDRECRRLSALVGIARRKAA